LNAYILGRHDGALPSHLLRNQGDEHGIFAMAPLTGDTHTVYYAASIPESATVGDVVGTLEGAGTSVEEVIVACVSDGCQAMIMAILEIIGPCKIPGPPEWVVFLVLEGLERLTHLEHALDRLGAGNVAAAYDGDGRFLVELASDDESLLDDVVRSFEELSGHRLISTHRLRGRDLQRV
jgi:hypothetical protein